MQVIHGIRQLRYFLEENDMTFGCLADTGFLYAATDTDDRLYEAALDAFELLEESNIPIYMNVISRMEFVDLIFRKQITLGAVQTFKKTDPTTIHKSLFNLLKNIRDEDTAHRNDRQSYKISEGKLKKLRVLLELVAGNGRWKDLCERYE